MGIDTTAVFFGATVMTAITENAALTYLGSLVEGLGEEFKIALVAGAVTGGDLTVIANASNPAGVAILRGSFEDSYHSPAGIAHCGHPAHTGGGARVSRAVKKTSGRAKTTGDNHAGNSRADTQTAAKLA